MTGRGPAIPTKRCGAGCLRCSFGRALPRTNVSRWSKAVLCDPAQGGSAVLAWAAEGAVESFASGLRVPDAVKSATESYRRSMDPLRDFFEDLCEFGPDYAVTAKRLREVYEGWARENGVRPISGRTLALRLEARGCERLGRHGGERWWTGVGLRA